ncbi:hypothetical protein FACS189474_1320 [Bacteroidia bacterium]|nr:hypothetical protein FACS189474_1320 [Bacteroidia bacterium]
MSKMIKITGVRRDTQYSPNHIENDAAIFNLASEHLKKHGFEVTEYSEEEFLNTPVTGDFIYTMARDTRTVEKLQALENEGKKVINSGYGINNCRREKMTRLLIAHHIPYPKTIIVQTNDPSSVDLSSLGSDCWIKRGDFHAIQRDDVVYARVGTETDSLIREYALRNISSIVINEHLEGDLVKFYGVSGTDFFHWFYPCSCQHTKYGLEAINGKITGIPFDVNRLKEICNQVAQVLNIRIYGGDCVIGQDGRIRIIDFNDWPSFAPCREEAAPFIAECIASFCLL